MVLSRSFGRLPRMPVIWVLQWVRPWWEPKMVVALRRRAVALHVAGAIALVPIVTSLG